MMDENTALNDTTNATTKDQEWKKKGYTSFVVSLALLLVVAFYAGQSRGARTSLAGSATEVVLVGAATASVVSSVEDNGEDGNNNENGPISGGGSVVEEAQSKEQESAPSSSTNRRRKLKPKKDCSFEGRSCGGVPCCSTLQCTPGPKKKGKKCRTPAGAVWCKNCADLSPCCSDYGDGAGIFFDFSCPFCSNGRI